MRCTYSHGEGIRPRHTANDHDRPPVWHHRFPSRAVLLVISNACVPTKRTSQPARNAFSPAAQSKKPCVRPDLVVMPCNTSSILTSSSGSKMAAKGLQSPIPKRRACNLASRHCLGYNRGTLCCAQIFGTLAYQGQYPWLGRLDHPRVLHTVDSFDNHARTK
jgi:hypothetical protein